MRQNIVPILESYDVDLVLCGHSHAYERSYLINGHYGFSSEWIPVTGATTSWRGPLAGEVSERYYRIRRME